jgi:hypothetical protein
MLEDGTYDKDGQKIAYPDGYQVGIWDKPLTMKPPVFEHKLYRMIKKMNRVSAEFGVWTDRNGDLYVEPCVWIRDLDSALTLALELNQIAIWDWANMKEIRLN